MGLFDSLFSWGTTKPTATPVAMPTHTPDALTDTVGRSGRIVAEFDTTEGELTTQEKKTLRAFVGQMTEEPAMAYETWRAAVVDGVKGSRAKVLRLHTEMQLVQAENEEPYLRLTLLGLMGLTDVPLLSKTPEAFLIKAEQVKYMTRRKKLSPLEAHVAEDLFRVLWKRDPMALLWVYKMAHGEIFSHPAPAVLHEINWLENEAQRLLFQAETVVERFISRPTFSTLLEKEAWNSFCTKTLQETILSVLHSTIEIKSNKNVYFQLFRAKA